VSVPLRKFYGAVPMIEVRVGNGPRVPVVLDTGSTGLQIYEPGVRLGAGSGVSVTSHPETVTYGGGDVLRGVLASAKLTIGHVKTRAPVRFGLISSASCRPQEPDCPQADGISGRVAHGFYGIMGIGLARSNQHVGNPLLELPRRYPARWSIALKGREDLFSLRGTSGRLILGARAPSHPVATFPLKRDGRDASGARAWNDQDPKVCWAAVGLRGKGCVPTVFDSGTSIMYWLGGLLSHTTTYPGSKFVMPGTYIAAWQHGAPHAFWTFTAGQHLSKNTLVALPFGKPFVIAAVTAFYRFRITYDAARGEIFLSRR
jgi:hypothetical protein